MADVYVADTGVFLRWFVKQAGWEHAREVRTDFLDGKLALETADSVRAELANVLRTKGLLAGRLDRTQFLSAVRAVGDLGVTIHATDADSLEQAAALAADRGVRIFDALMVHRSLERKFPLLTTDAKLCRAVDGLVSTELLRGVDGR